MRAPAWSSTTCTATVLMLAGVAGAVDPLTIGITGVEPELVLTGSLRQEVEQVDPTTLSCDGVITFDDVSGGDSPGTDYDAIVESDGANFAERFVGQAPACNGDFDTLPGLPTGPLALRVGDPFQSLNVYYRYDPTNSRILTGLGPVGWPDFDVSEIDPATVEFEGVAPIRWTLADVTTSAGRTPGIRRGVPSRISTGSSG